jgi:hypothetical protein
VRDLAVWGGAHLWPGVYTPAKGIVFHLVKRFTTSEEGATSCRSLPRERLLNKRGVEGQLKVEGSVAG